ncbi:MAG TPA: CBS domain-containing protein [bacterium]|nr:CBS domain-containing protein [bacterium]
MSTNVGSVMTKSAVTIKASDSLLSATRVLKEKGFKHLPVVDGNGALVGVVTDRDLKRASASDATTLEVHELLYLLDKLKIEQVMTRKPVTVTSAETVQGAAKLMVDRKIGCLPVVDGNKVAGILTKDDLLRLVARSDI